MTESRSDRFQRDWNEIRDDRKIRGFDEQAIERKDRDFPEWDGDTPSEGFAQLSIPGTFNYELGMSKVVYGTASAILPDNSGTYIFVETPGNFSEVFLQYNASDYQSKPNPTMIDFVALCLITETIPEAASIYPVGSYLSVENIGSNDNSVEGITHVSNINRDVSATIATYASAGLIMELAGIGFLARDNGPVAASFSL